MTRQQTRFLALMAGWDQASKYAEEAANSTGLAAEKLEIYQESLAAKQAKFTASFEAFSQTMLNSGLVAFAYDAGAGFLNLAAGINPAIASFIELTAVIAGATVAFNALKVSSFGASIGASIKKIGSYLGEIISTVNATGAAARAIGAASSGATDSLNFSLQTFTAGLWENIKAMAAWMVTNPVGQIMLIAGAFGIAKAAADKFGLSAEGAAKKFQEAQSAYTSTANELGQISSELKNIENRISELDDLSKLGRLTPDQKAELEDLKDSNAELERKEKMLENIARIQQEEANRAAGAAYAKTTYSSINTRYDDLEGKNVSARLNGAEYIQELLDGLRNIEKAKAKIESALSDNSLSTADIARAKGELDKLTETYNEYELELARVVPEQRKIADGISATDGPLHDIKVRIFEAIDAWDAFGKSSSMSTDNAASAITQNLASLKGHLSTLSDIEDKFKTLSEALGEFRDDGIVSLGTLSELESTFGSLSTFESFVNVVGNSKSTFTQVRNACNSLAESYINNKVYLGDLTEETKAMTIAELESIGVTNAATVVNAELAVQRVNAKVAALDHANATYADVAAIYDEAIKAETDTVAIQRLRLEKLKGRAASIDFATANSSVIASLVSEANAAGIASSKISALIQLERIRARVEAVDAGLGTGGLTGTEYREQRERLDSLARQAKAQVNSVKADLITLSDVTIKPPKISSSSGSSGSSSSNKNTKTQEQLRKEEFEALYNEKKHQLAMERISTQEFYDWLVDAKKGYMAYFKENSEEFRKYEEEAFALRKELADDYISSIDDEIEMLERQDDSESLIIAKYREKQQVIKELMEAHVAYLKSIGASEDAIANNDYLKDLLKSWWEIQDSIDDITESLNNDLADGMQSILDMTIEIVKKEGEEAKKALEEQKDEYNDIIAKRRELLKMSEQERQYQDEVSEKNKELEKIEARIASLRADDSREAAAERGALEEQRAELQKELANMQNDHYLDSADAALEKELDDWNAQQDAKIEAIEDLLDDEVRLTEIAMERLDNMNEELFQDLLTYATTYCDMSRHEFEEMWNDALAAAEKYGSYTNAMEAVPGNGKETEASKIIDQMRQNGAAWAAATTDAERDYYAKQNEKLGRQLSEVTGEKVYRDAGGHWWIGDEYLFDYGKGTGNADSSVSRKNAEKVSEIVSDMREYSKKWGSSSSDKQKIHETVALMAKDLEKYGVFVEFNSGSGKWIITQDNNDPAKKGKWLYEVYHRGGVAGGYADLRQREILAKLEVGEMILTKEHQANLSRLLDSFTPIRNIGAMLASMASKLNGGVGGNNVTVQVNAPLSVHSDISSAKFKKMAQENARYIANEVAKVVGAR